MVFFGSGEPLQGAEYTYEFTLDRPYIGLNLTPVEAIAEVTDSEKEPNLLGQATLSSLVAVEHGDGVFSRESKRPNGPLKRLLEPGLNHGCLTARVHHFNGCLLYTSPSPRD